MKKYELIQIGDFHTNHCDDYVMTAELDKQRFLCAVMDGCTMGTNSYIASGITGIVLRKIAKEINYRTFKEKNEIDLKILLIEILSKLFHELRLIKNQLQLERDELLSTLTLVLVDLDLGIAESISIGDGLIYCNGQSFEYEQNDKPDYLGYHLDEDFENWYSGQKQRLSLRNINDLSISSDGIFTFKNYQNDNKIIKHSEDIVDFLLNDTDGFENENMLKRKMLIITNNWGYKPIDDIGIIRLIT
jgi:serine/threonine protein phosphatase PrpC